ncbi:hypothetical protein G6F46_007977 [Rhizopus delemar]|uniref:Uncharacterized protein n=2 Tax=Rhizopus TaxID=4842 RepID=A0A9P6YYP3_9FUNG|nr:hypothetical protein G6F36_015913 [Rhizopus arrhizus]KAG1453355.1 hypothetical protein G6F55_008189 [Rhizopus delemar]KAG1493219.1 hypothetical protein G6F54_008736 [Rhizopus delemar]KAG1507272.1 hypothetical protein G6F53_009077 [Rhizopus delemar]KAG1517130.1 hypothetical protein G6F52_009297 [Rhizopus delemar]
MITLTRYLLFYSFDDCQNKHDPAIDLDRHLGLSYSSHLRSSLRNQIQQKAKKDTDVSRMRVPMIQVYLSDNNLISYCHTKELGNTIAGRSDYEKDARVLL